MKKIIQSEKGAALPMVLIAIALGALVIPSFLNHTGTSLISSKAYVREIHTQYAADSGAEHAIWNLKYGGLGDTLADIGDNVTYSLDETLNGMEVSITVIKTGEPDDFSIASSAGDKAINASVSVNGTEAKISSWILSS
jgi:hypothetical protein